MDYEQLAVDVERAKAGDEDAFARLYEKTCQIVYSIAASKLKDTEKAKDVVSEVYIRVFRYLSTLRDSRSFVRWLMVITDNVCAEHKNDRRTDAALQALYPDQMPDTDDPIADWEEKEGLRELMQGLIHLLPEAQQRTVYYFYFKQLTLSQIAAIENCPVNTVKTRLFHARDTLRRAILEEEKRSGDKYHLPVATVAMAALMALPDTGFTLAAEDVSRIFMSVLTALGMQYTGERSASFVTVIHEDADDGSLHAKLFRRSYLVKLSPAMTLLAVLLTLLLAATAGIAYFRKAALPAAALSNDPIACASAADAALPLPTAAERSPRAVVGTDPAVTYTFEIENGEITLCTAQISDPPALTELTIPTELDGLPVTRIGDELFSDNPYIQTLIIPPPVRHIGKEAFYNCTGITELQLPETLESLGDHAFSYCTGITELALPASLTLDLETSSPFANMKSLRHIYVRLGNKQLVSINDVVYTADGKTLVLYPADKPGEEYTLLESTERLAPYCMASNHLITVHMSDNVREIGPWSFAFCEMLDWLDLSSNLEVIGDNGLGAPNLTMLRIRLGGYRFCTAYGALYSADRSVLYRYPAGKSDTSYTVPETVKEIGSFAFFCAENLESLTLPDSVTTLGKCALAYMPGVRQVRLSEAITALPERALAFNYSVKAYTIPATVTSVSPDAFAGCPELARVSFTGDAPAGAQDAPAVPDSCVIRYPAARESWKQCRWQEQLTMQAYEE